VHDDEGLMGDLFVRKELPVKCQPSEEEREAEIQKCFIAAGGVNRRHIDYECVGQSLCEDTNKQQLVGWLRHWLHIDLDEELSPDIRIVDTTTYVSYSKLGYLKEKIANALFELAALLRPLESVELGGAWYYAESIRRMAVQRYGIESIADRIYNVKGVDKGRDAWYYVLVTGSRKKFLKCLIDDIIHLEDHGSVLCSAYFDEPSEDITQRIKEMYNIK
jgi:hypothetical protein